MKYGISMFPTDYSISPGRFAGAIEARGFESFWVPEHSHFPVSDMRFIARNVRRKYHVALPFCYKNIQILRKLLF